MILKRLLVTRSGTTHICPMSLAGLPSQTLCVVETCRHLPTGTRQAGLFVAIAIGRVEVYRR